MGVLARGQRGWAPQPGSASTTQACLAGSVLYRGNWLIWGTAGREELELGKRQSTTALTLKNRSGGSRRRNRLQKVEAQHALPSQNGLCPVLGVRGLGGGDEALSSWGGLFWARVVAAPPPEPWCPRRRPFLHRGKNPGGGGRVALLSPTGQEPLRAGDKQGLPVEGWAGAAACLE